MPYLQIPGLKIHYIEQGQGPETLLLVHGNVSSSEYWTRFLATLPSDFRALALDLRGCGQTEHTGEGYSIPQFVDDIHQFSQSLGLTHFHLLGHSMGGQTSMLFTLEHPEKVRTLVLLDSVPADGLLLNDEIRASFKQLQNNRDLLRTVMETAVMPYGPDPSRQG